MAQLFWRRRFLNFVIVLSLFRYYLSVEKSMALYLKKYEFPLYTRDEEGEHVTEKFTDGQTYDVQQVIRKAQLTSLFQLR